MSTNNRTDLLAWIAEVQAIAAQQSRPIEGTSDPRFIALAEKYGVNAIQNDDAAELGDNYFRVLGAALLPEPPVDRPAWVDSLQYTLSEFPEALTIEFQGKVWEAGIGNGPEAFAQLLQTFTIALVDFDDCGTERHAGDVWEDGPVSIQFSYLEPTRGGSVSRLADVTIDGAFALSTALGDVLHGMPFGTTVAA